MGCLRTPRQQHGTSERPPKRALATTTGTSMDPANPDATRVPGLPRPIQAGSIYARECGWRVLPLVEGGKRPCITNWPREATTDLAQIEAWLTTFPNANIGIATGSDLLVLDVDPRHGGTVEGLSLPETAQAATPSGGEHFFFRGVAGLRNSAGKLGPGLDIRGEGGQVAVAPSRTPAGVYRWIKPPWATPLAPIPQWLVDRLTAGQMSDSNRRSGAEWAELIREVSEGGRDETLTRVAGILFRKLPAAFAFEVLCVVNEARCKPPLDDRQVEKIANSIAGRELTP